MLSEAYIDALQVHRTATLALRQAGGLFSEPEPRSSVTSRPRRHGSTVRASFYEGRVLELEGICRGDSPALALAALEELKAATRLGTEHVFKFRALGTPELEEELAVVFVSKLEVGTLSLRGFSWAVQAVAADPRRYSTTRSSSSYDPTAAGGGARGLVFPLTFPLTFGGESVTTLEADVGGDFPTPPLLTIVGPVSNPIIDNETTGESLYTLGLDLAAGESAQVDVSARELLVGAGGGSGGPTYPEVIIDTDALLGYWRLADADAAAGVADAASGLDGTWTDTGALTYQAAGPLADEPSLSVTFGSGTDHAEIPNTGDELSFAGVAPFTLEAWASPTGLSAALRRIFSTEDAAGVSGVREGYYLGVDQDGLHLARYANGSAAGSNICDGPFTFTEGSWYHLAGTFDGSTYTVYINGAEVGSSSPASPKSIVAQASTLGLGLRLDTASGGFLGGLAELAAYSRALTPAEILDHYTLGLEGASAPAAFTGGSRPDLIDAKRSSWWMLAPGENQLRLRGDGMSGGSTELRVSWQDARL